MKIGDVKGLGSSREGASLGRARLQLATLDADDVPEEKPVGGALQIKLVRLAGSGGHVDTAVTGEASLGARVVPQLIDREQGFGEARDATDVSDDEAAELASPISSNHRKISDELDSAGFAIDTGHRLVRGAMIDEVFGKRMAVHGAPAVDHQLE